MKDRDYSKPAIVKPINEKGLSKKTREIIYEELRGTPLNEGELNNLAKTDPSEAAYIDSAQNSSYYGENR